MLAKIPSISVEEYLGTSFEGTDSDYVDGEVVERNRGEALHAAVQFLLARMLHELRVFRTPMTEIRMLITPDFASRISLSGSRTLTLAPEFRRSLHSSPWRSCRRATGQHG